MQTLKNKKSDTHTRVKKRILGEITKIAKREKRSLKMQLEIFLDNSIKNYYNEKLSDAN